MCRDSSKLQRETGKPTRSHDSRSLLITVHKNKGGEGWTPFPVHRIFSHSKVVPINGRMRVPGRRCPFLFFHRTGKGVHPSPFHDGKRPLSGECSLSGGEGRERADNVATRFNESATPAREDLDSTNLLAYADKKTNEHVILPRVRGSREREPRRPVATWFQIKRAFDRGAVSQLRDSEGGGVMRHSVFPFRMREVTRSVFAFSNPRYWPQAELKLRRRRAVTP